MLKNIFPYLIVVTIFALVSCGGSSREIIIVKPPPPGYAVPASPGIGYTWMYGYWVRRGRRTIWVPGYWQSPEGFRPGKYRRR